MQQAKKIGILGSRLLRKVCESEEGWEEISDIAIGEYKAMKSWQYTSKFTYDHPDFKSIGGFFKCWGPWTELDQKIQLLSDLRCSDFWSNFQFSYFFPISLSKINQKG